MTNFNFLSKFVDWLGELSSRMSIVGVSYEVGKGKMSTSRIASNPNLTPIGHFRKVLVLSMSLVIVGVGNVFGDTSRLTLKSSTSRTSGWTDNNVTWTFSNLSFVNDANACVKSSTGSITITPPSGAIVSKITVAKTTNAWAGAAQLKLFVGSSSTAHTTLTSSSSTTTDISITGTDQSASSYTLSNSTNKNCWVDYIEITFTAGSTCSTPPTVAAPNKGSFNWA